PCFLLLRSYSGAGVQDDWAKKGEICLHAPFFSFLQGDSSSTRSARTSSLICSNPCPNPIAPVEVNCERRFVAENFNEKVSPSQDYAPCGWCKLQGETPDLQECGSPTVAGNSGSLIPYSKDKGKVIGLYYSIGGDYGFHQEFISRTFTNLSGSGKIYTCKFEATLFPVHSSGYVNDVEVIVNINGKENIVPLQKQINKFNDYQFSFEENIASNLTVKIYTRAKTNLGRSYVLLDDFRIYEAIQLPSISPPVLSSNKVQIDSGSSTVISSSQCQNGNVHWEHGVVGSSITVYPTVTTTYSAYCVVNGCESSRSSMTITVVKPSITLTASKKTICPSESLSLTATVYFCSGIVSWQKAAFGSTNFEPLLSNGKAVEGQEIKVNEIGTYRATCGNVSGSITIFPSGSISPPTIGVGGNAPASLAGNCAQGTLVWSDGSYGVTRNNVPAGEYTARCQDGSCISAPTKVLVTAPTSVSIRAGTSSLCNQATTTIAVVSLENCSATNLVWYLNDVQISEWNQKISITSGEGIYKVRCNDKWSNEIAILRNSTPSPPAIRTDKTNVQPSEVATITAEGCNGLIKWYKNGTLLNEANNAGNILFVHPSTATGNYTATCSSSCGTSGFSNLISLSNSAVYIESNKPVSEVYPNEEIILTAHGCAANWYVEWELRERFTSFTISITNPLTVSGYGLYRARCVNSYNANETTPWASIVLLERPMNKPHLVADPGCVYDNQQKTLVASGCGGLPIEWFDGVRQGNPSSRNLNPGIYSARCYSSSSTGTSYGPWEFYEICRIDPNPVVITANKTSVNPLELFELTGSNCVSGGVQWLTPAGEYVWGNTLTAAGPGIYRARCVVSDRSIGAWTSFTMTAKPPGLLTITSNKSRARSNEPVTLTATGCSNGHVMWSYVPNGKTTEVLERGQSITAFGYGTYYAWCVSLGMSGTRADYTVSELTGNIPSVTTDKQKAAPNDPVFVSMSGCSNPEWYWLKVTLPDGRVVYPTNTNGKSVVYGPFTYEAACVNYGGGIDGKTTGSVGLSLVDHLRVVPNKSRVGANESVLLTAYGCDFGKLEWRIGGEIQPAFSGQTSITQVGPGNYYARCRGDLFKSDDWVLAIVNPATDIIP
ncbi:MAG: hypothetical protein ACK4UP_12490, partial [Spirosomataceae bacterium]